MCVAARFPFETTLSSARRRDWWDHPQHQLQTRARTCTRAEKI